MCLFIGLASVVYAQAPVSQSQVYISMDDTEVNYGVNHLPQLGGPPSYVSVNRNPLVPPPVVPVAVPAPPIVNPITAVRPPFYGDVLQYGNGLAPILRSRVGPLPALYGNAPFIESPYNTNPYPGLLPPNSSPYAASPLSVLNYGGLHHYGGFLNPFF